MRNNNPGNPVAQMRCSVRCFFSVRRMSVLFIICTCKWLQLYTFPLTGLSVCVWSCRLFLVGMLLLDSMQLWTTPRSIWKGGSMYVWAYNNLRGNSCFIELRSIDCVCAYQKMCWMNLSVFEFLACLWETENEEIFKSTYVYYRTLPNERAFAKSVRNKNTSKIISLFLFPSKALVPNVWTRVLKCYFFTDFDLASMREGYR